MRSKRMPALILALSLLLCSCGNSTTAQAENQTVETTDEIDVLMSSIEERVREGYDTAEAVTDLCTKAATIKNNVDACLIEMDTAGAGMIRGEVFQTFDITVNDSVWTVSAANPKKFKSSGSSYGNCGKEGTGKASDLKSSATCGEELIAIVLGNCLPDVKNAAVKLVCKDGGKCNAVIYTEDKNTTLEEGVDCPALVNGTYDPTSFSWDGTDGVSPSGILVGTAPMFK